MEKSEFMLSKLTHIDAELYEKDKNRIIQNGEALDMFFGKLDNLLTYGEQKVKILHIGDSHIQADYFSGHTRKLLQSTFGFGNGDRGFLFPYQIAKTNNPPNYKVIPTGNWTSCRNVEYKKECNLGLSGISVTTSDTNAAFVIALSHKQTLDYSFNKVKIFHDTAFAFKPVALDAEGNFHGDWISTQHFETYTELSFFEEQDTLRIGFQRKNSKQTSFTLYGLEFTNEFPGIEYSASGVNGASVKAYMRCGYLFEKHLKVLNPDLMIISLGTNDAYTYKFNETAFEQLYQQLLNRIRKAVPKAEIILTTPSDGYRSHYYANYNNKKATESILKLAKHNKLAAWNFYEIMGGYKAINKWKMAGFARPDRLHFTKEGYFMQAELFYMALMDAYDEHLEKKQKNKKK